MNRLFFCFFCLFTLTAWGSDANRYNVLFIAVDDLRPELGAYGAGYAQTPSLDKLAEEGVVFTNHFVQVATCGASRFSLLTGRSPGRSQVTRDNWAFTRGPGALLAEQQDGAQTLPELFRRSGYRTIQIGKISHTADGRVFAYDGSGDGRPEMPHAWDELATPFGPWKRGWGVFFGYRGGRHREDGGTYYPLMEFEAERDEELPDGMLAEAAIQHLRRLSQGDRPFFMGLGFIKPHLPFVATKGDWEAFADTEIPPPPHATRPDTAYWHPSNEFYRYQLPFPDRNPLAPADRLTAKRAYLAAVRFVDRQIGKVLAELETLGLADRTIVVVWGDHGWHLGDFQIWGKHTPLERAQRSALILRVPGLAKNGQPVDALVASLDLYPTLVELCRPRFQQTRFPLDGRSLVPLLNGKVSSVREYVASFWNEAISIRTATHRLIATRQAGVLSDIELYDLTGGRDSSSNIAAREAALAEQLAGMISQEVD